MKKYISFLLLFIVSLQTFGQVIDTTTDEKKARYRIARIRDNSVRAITPNDFRGAFNAVTKLAIGRVPFLSVSDLRAGKADTARVVEINDGDRSGTFIYDPADANSVDDTTLVIRHGARRYKRKIESSLNLKWYVKGDGVTDVGDKIQRAINAISSRAGNLNPVSFVTSLEVPAGTYVIGRTIKLPINVRLKPVGHVVFLFTNPGVGLHIYNDSNVTPVFYKEMYTRGSIIDASNGNFNVFHKDFFNGYTLNYGTSISRSNITAGTVGIQIGQTTGGRMVPRYLLADVGIAGFETGLDLICTNNYMATFERLHIEGNINAIRTNAPSGGSTNAGENMTFYKCLIAGADNAINCQGAAMDMTFDMCSIDFVKKVLYMDTMYRGYNWFDFRGCYFESVSEYFVDNASTAGLYRAPEIFFNGCKALNGRKEMFRSATSGKGIQVYFNGFSYRIDNGTSETDGREAWNSQDPDHFMLVKPASGVSIRNKDVYSSLAIPVIVENNVDDIYPYFNYNNAALGALGTNNIYFQQEVGTNVASRAIVADGRVSGTNALKVVSTAGAAGLFKVRSQENYPVSYGDVFGMNIIYKVDSEVGTTDTTVSNRYQIDEYSELGELLNTTTEVIYTDKFSPGVWRAGRWGAEFRISNRRTKYIRFHYTVSGFVGALYIDKIVIDKR